jgi:hypothetical protein
VVRYQRLLWLERKTAEHGGVNRVLPFGEERGVEIGYLLTDTGREYCGRPVGHPFDFRKCPSKRSNLFVVIGGKPVTNSNHRCGSASGKPREAIRLCFVLNLLQMGACQRCLAGAKLEFPKALASL